MPSGVGTRLTVEVLRLTASDVARGAQELVELERAAASAWKEAPDEEQERIRTIVRAALFRLLRSDHWMPGAIGFAGGRIDVRLTIEVDRDADIALAEARAELAALRNEARKRLIALLADLGEDEDDGPTA